MVVAATMTRKRAVLARIESRRKGARVVTIGESFEATLALPPDSIKSFATLVNDLNPLHHDDAYARASRFGSLIASGTQPTAHLMAMLATHFSQVRAAARTRIRHQADARGEGERRAHDDAGSVTDAKWKASLNGDLVKLEGEARNQHGETVMKATRDHRRDAEGAGAHDRAFRHR